MPFAYPVLCKTTTTTDGTNDYVLSTANLSSAHRTPEQAVADGSLANGDTVTYICRDTTVTGDAAFEAGEGVYNHTTKTVSRLAANVFDSPTGPGSLHSWPASGVRDIYFIDVPPKKTARTDQDNSFSTDQTISKAGSTAKVVLKSTDSNATQVRLLTNNAQHRFVAADVNDTVVGLIDIRSDGEMRFQDAAGQYARFHGAGKLELNKGAVINESGGDNDTRIEGDTDPNLSFWDASTDRVGVGTATPSAKLTVNGDVKCNSLEANSGDLFIKSRVEITDQNLDLENTVTTPNTKFLIIDGYTNASNQKYAKIRMSDNSIQAIDIDGMVNTDSKTELRFTVGTATFSMVNETSNQAELVFDAAEVSNFVHCKRMTLHTDVGSTSAPAAGAVLYIDGGVLKVRFANGTIKSIADDT